MSMYIRCISTDGWWSAGADGSIKQKYESKWIISVKYKNIK